MPYVRRYSSYRKPTRGYKTRYRKPVYRYSRARYSNSRRYGTYKKRTVRR